MPRFLHSSSAQKYFSGCPQQFWLYQNGAEKGASPENFRFGITAHLVMQMYVDHCIGAGRRSDVTVIGDIIDTAVRKTHLSLASYDELSAVIRGYLAVYEIDVQHSLEREGGIAFDDQLNVIPWRDVYDYDQMRRPMDHAANGVLWRLRLDETLLYPEDRRLVVRDFKTDLFAPSQSAIDQPSSRFNQQARKYAWAAWRRYGNADIVEVEFSFMRYCDFGRALTRRLVFTKDQLLEIEEQELAKVRFIEETADFPARPGDHCNSCAFRDTSCPVATEVVTEDPETIARQYVFQQVLQEERRARIKAFVAEHGWSGEVGALRSQFQQGESLKPDMEIVWKELQDIGLEKPWRVLNFSKTDAEILDKDAYERIIATAYSPDITVRFNLHQPKPELQRLAAKHGIPLQVQGKTGMKDKTVAQLACDLANYEPVDASHMEPADEQPVVVPISTISEVA